MRPLKVSSETSAVLFTSMLLLAVTMAGCQEKSSEQGAESQSPAQGPAQGSGDGGGGGGGGGQVRIACQVDIQTLCASEERVGRCLRNHLDRLSEGCRTAIDSRGSR